MSRPTQSMPAALAGAEANTQQYLVFTLNGEAFAIGILHIKEIIEYGHLTDVPMMPTLVRGVINLRGAVVPVIDLSVRFNRQPTKTVRRTCVVILEMPGENGTQTVGVLVDAVNEVIDIPAADIDPAPNFGARIRTDFIEGMGKVAGQFVILLNVACVLSMDELSDLAGIAEGAALPASAGEILQEAMV